MSDFADSRANEIHKPAIPNGEVHEKVLFVEHEVEEVGEQEYGEEESVQDDEKGR